MKSNNNKGETVVLNKIFQLEKDKSLLLDFILDQYQGIIKTNPKYSHINENNKESLNVSEFIDYIKKRSISPQSSLSSFPSPQNTVTNISPPKTNSNIIPLTNLHNNSTTTTTTTTNFNNNNINNDLNLSSTKIPTQLPNNYGILTKEQFHFASFECYLLLSHFSRPSELKNLAEEEELFRVQMEIPKVKYNGFIKLLTPNHSSKHPLFISLTYRLWLLKYFDFKQFDSYDSLLIWFKRQLYFILNGIINFLKDPFDDKENNNQNIQTLKLYCYELERVLIDSKPTSVIDEDYQRVFQQLDQYIGSILVRNSSYLSKQIVLATEYLNEPILHQFPLNTLIFEDLLFYNLFEFKEDEIIFVGDEHHRIPPTLKSICSGLRISPTMEKISHLNCFVLCYQSESTNEHFKRLQSTLDDIQHLVESNPQAIQDPNNQNTGLLLKLTLKKIATWLIKILSDIHSYKVNDNPSVAIDIACRIYTKSREMWGALSTSATSAKNGTTPPTNSTSTIRTGESNFVPFISSSVSCHYHRLAKPFRPMTLDNFSDFIELLTPEIKLDLDMFISGFKSHHSTAKIVALNEFVNLYSADLKVVFADVYFLSPMVLKSVQTASQFQLFLEDLNLIPLEKLPPVKNYVSSVIIAWCQNQEKSFNKWFENSFKLDKFLPLDKDIKHSSSVIDMFQMFYQTISTLSKMKGCLSDKFPSFILTLSSMFNNCLLVYESSIMEITSSNQKNLLYPLSINERIHKKGKVRRSLSLSNPIIGGGGGSGSGSGSGVSNNLSSAGKVNGTIATTTTTPGNPYSQLTPNLQLKLSNTSLLTLCVCLNNLEFIVHNLNDYIEHHSYSNEDLKVKLTELFQPVILSFNNSIRQLIDFIGCRIVFYDSKSTILESTYLAPLLDNSDRIQSVLDSLNPHLKTIYSTVQSIQRANEILSAVCKSFVQAMKWILLYSGPTRIYQPKDASLIEYDIELIKDFFLDRDGQGNANGVPEKIFDEYISNITKIVNLLMELSSDVLIEQFNHGGGGGGGVNRNIFDNDIILSVLIHRGDKTAKNFLKKKEHDPIYSNIKKGSKINFS